MKKSGAIILPSLHAFVAWREKTATDFVMFEL
jgi:hypothetical protein